MSSSGLYYRQLSKYCRSESETFSFSSCAKPIIILYLPKESTKTKDFRHFFYIKVVFPSRDLENFVTNYSQICLFPVELLCIWCRKSFVVIKMDWNSSQVCHSWVCTQEDFGLWSILWAWTWGEHIALVQGKRFCICICIRCIPYVLILCVAIFAGCQELWLGIEPENWFQLEDTFA